MKIIKLVNLLSMVLTVSVSCDRLDSLTKSTDNSDKPDELISGYNPDGDYMSCEERAADRICTLEVTNFTYQCEDQGFSLTHCDDCSSLCSEPIADTLTCSHEGETYQAGQPVPSEENCDNCFCDGETGEVVCQMIACCGYQSEPESSYHLESPALMCSPPIYVEE